jgi:hypothetical protein
MRHPGGFNEDLGICENSIVRPSLHAPDKCVVHIHRVTGSDGIAMCVIQFVILGRNTPTGPMQPLPRMILGDAASRTEGL